MGCCSPSVAPPFVDLLLADKVTRAEHDLALQAFPIATWAAIFE